MSGLTRVHSVATAISGSTCEDGRVTQERSGGVDPREPASPRRRTSHGHPPIRTSIHSSRGTVRVGAPPYATRSHRGTARLTSHAGDRWPVPRGSRPVADANHALPRPWRVLRGTGQG